MCSRGGGETKVAAYEARRRNYFNPPPRLFLRTRLAMRKRQSRGGGVEGSSPQYNRIFSILNTLCAPHLQYVACWIRQEAPLFLKLLKWTIKPGFTDYLGWGKEEFPPVGAGGDTPHRFPGGGIISMQPLPLNLLHSPICIRGSGSTRTV